MLARAVRRWAELRKIIPDDRLGCVVHEILHRAETRDNLGRVARADMDDLGNGEVEREVITRAPGDRAELVVEVVRLGAVGPV